MKQMLTKECAVICVWMIIRYYKGFVSLAKLEVMLKTTRNGTNAYHIVETLKELGFNAYGIKLNKLKPTKNPFIANVVIDNIYKHYVVVYEVNNDYLVLADPNSSGIKRISLRDFYDIWTGINIEMYPIKNIVNDKPKTFMNTIKLIKINKKQLFLIGFLSFISTSLAICSTFFFKLLIDHKEEHIEMIAIPFLILFIIKNIINYIREKQLIKCTFDADKNLAIESFKKIMKLPYRYYHNHTSGEIISKINDLSALRNVLNKIVLTIFVDLPLTILSGILLFIINRQLLLIVIITLILYIVIIFIYHKKIDNNIDNFLHKKADINSFMHESISGFETIKGIDIEEKINELFIKKYNDYNSLNINLNQTLNKQTTYKNIVSDFGEEFIIIFEF